MTDNLEHLLANVDDLDDLIRDQNIEANEQSEPENLEVSVESEEFPETLQENFDTADSLDKAEPEVTPPRGAVPVEPLAKPEAPVSQGVKNRFSVPGTKEWNSGSPYVITIDDASLEKEIRQLSNIFYFVNAPVDDPSGSDIIKKALVDYMRKPERGMLEKYKIFLYQELLKELLEINTLFLEKESDEKELFYHLGPVTIEKILMAKFKHEKRGYCYCYTGSGKGIRLFPEETIKTVIMTWFSENIFSARINFDNITLYDRMKRKVNEKYREDRKRFQMLLEKVNLRAGEGRSVSAGRFLALKGNDIFGPAKLQVYRRFIGNNIFI